MSKRILQTISANVTAWMEASKDLDTLEKLVAKSGVSFGTVRRIKNGEVNATISNLDDIARAFGKTAADLVSENSYAHSADARAIVSALPKLPPYIVESWVDIAQRATAPRLSTESSDIHPSVAETAATLRKKTKQKA